MGHLSLAYIVLVFLTIGSAVIVVTNRNIVHSAVALGVTFLGVAGMYVLLGFVFLAAAQVLIYVGAIIILILFAIMMTAQRLMREPRGGGWSKLVPGALAVSLFAVLVYVINGTPWPDRRDLDPWAGDDVSPLADTMMQVYLLPFEVAAVFLLVALVGAIILAKEERTD